MKLTGVWVLAAAIACALGTFTTPRAVADEVIIGTGSTEGVYYQVGRAICRLVTRNAPGLDCSALPTDGSLFNLSNVRGGAIEFGLAQSDWQYHAYNHSGPFEFMDDTYENLRALFSVHSEPFTVVARRDSGIRSLDDLRGRRVNIGNPGSGQRATMEVVMAAKGWSRDDFLVAQEYNAAEQSLALCNDRIEAMVYTVGHPNASVSKATGLCDAQLVDVKGPEIDKLVMENPYYAYALIPGGIYASSPEAVTTFGVKATVVSSADTDAETVYAVVKAVFDNFEQFKRMHPAFGTLEPSKMMTEGLSAPLHEGAQRYFQEQGLM